MTQCLAVLLYGMMVAQAYVYMLHSKSDRAALKAVVVAVCFLETLHTAFLLHQLYFYTVLNFLNLAEASNIVWSTGPSVLLETFICALVQGFYVYRIWILSDGSVISTIAPAVLLVGRVAFGFASSIIIMTSTTFADIRGHTGPMFAVTCGLALSLVTDLVIALLLIFYLFRSEAAWISAESVVRGLIAYTVNTGALTTIASLLVLVTFLSLKQSLLFGAFPTTGYTTTGYTSTNESELTTFRGTDMVDHSGYKVGGKATTVDAHESIMSSPTVVHDSPTPGKSSFNSARV
ncbi:unnamed protein product [Somion occarium]|uniref:DUF6534 domain-containing protein n=1 Tax=Somion occarium TaxID=3059160 RepID=A0ABP1D6M9_9APHY